MVRYTRCYVCDRRSALQNAVRIGGEENVGEAILYVARRDGLGLPPQEVILDTRICFNCHQSIRIELNVIQGNPSAVRLNVLRQTRNASCVICNAVDDLQRLSDDCIRKVARNRNRFQDENRVNDEEFVYLTSVTKPQFEDMFAYCDRVAQQAGFRYVKRKDLIMLLCKLRQGLSDEFLTVLFSYSSRRATSLAVPKVRQSFMQRFVPENIGLGAITRQQYIQHHVTEFSRQLYNPGGEEELAIIFIDATYTYRHKSMNFRALRQTYCLHKGRHLVSPTLLVAPDGYILDIFPPYFSDARNNDAAILQNEMLDRNDGGGLDGWCQPLDIFVFDKGYRIRYRIGKIVDTHVSCLHSLNPVNVSSQLKMLMQRG
ncbi:hypothetical protein QAD02_008401 [Eretmocerus hayati]|uniref:Uncharacterized protein n=1 Tax=Eretmocerus hayati TaxID=131215 RepID=A0ACC2N8S4_9HYME|nr:hypothetical protein QAD02_008401 [Eretmocerus hayati]